MSAEVQPECKCLLSCLDKLVFVMDVIVNVEFEGKLRESAAASSSSSSSGFICSIWCLTWYPGRKKTLVWAEEKPSILSVLKFDSEVQDPGRQKANGGGGKKGRAGRRRFFYLLREE